MYHSEQCNIKRFALEALRRTRIRLVVGYGFYYMICSDSGCRIRLCADGTGLSKPEWPLVLWRSRLEYKGATETRLLAATLLFLSSPPFPLCFALLSHLRLHRTSE